MINFSSISENNSTFSQVFQKITQHFETIEMGLLEITIAFLETGGPFKPGCTVQCEYSTIKGFFTARIKAANIIISATFHEQG